MSTAHTALETAEFTNGPSPDFHLSWNAFVHLVLELTIVAYQRMRRDRVVDREWDEDTFTANLAENYIQPLANQHPLAPLVVVCQSPVYTALMKSGKVSTRHAGKIDIKIFIRTWDYTRVYFAWECKRIGDRRADKRYRNLIREYVSQGIKRFSDAKYSSEVSDAGMLGYVLSGDIPWIAGEINKTLKLPSEHLVRSAAVYGFSDVYDSVHQRAGYGPAHLYHLFLTFDF